MNPPPQSPTSEKQPTRTQSNPLPNRSRFVKECRRKPRPHFTTLLRLALLLRLRLVLLGLPDTTVLGLERV